MASYQRVALYIFFDAIERDLVDSIRLLPIPREVEVISHDERVKAKGRLEKRENISFDEGDDYSLLYGLDIGDKYSVLMRHKNYMSLARRQYYTAKKVMFEKAVPVRNATMHGRPLTTTEYAFGFSLANEFLKSGSYWPTLYSTYKKYTGDQQSFFEKSISLLDDDVTGESLNNLPVPDYEDTGFQPRHDLERDLRKKILGRHPVITVLGEGGNGKTALALQTLYGLLNSNDHGFDAIAWVSAKTSKLTFGEVERIEGAITTSLGIYEKIADLFEPGDDTPLQRVRRLLENNKVLLLIDNLETILDDSVREFASDVPGNSKLVFTSRVPLGSDLTVFVGDFSEREARDYVRRLIEAYDIPALAKKTNEEIDQYAKKLNCKPLLLKWFALGVVSGLDPNKITANPEIALKFCMENVIDRLSSVAKNIAVVFAVLSTPVSPAIAQELIAFSPTEIEAGLAELQRFGLIQANDDGKHEKLYQLKSFSKSYIVRVLKISPDFSNDILSKFRRIDNVFQIERGNVSYNKYEAHSYMVRSRSEALTCQKLRRVISAANANDIEAAEKLIADAKISSPEYFEVSRIEAFLAYKCGDIPRAVAAYEVAIELDGDQPQLHFFYAGILCRSLSDYKEAGRHLGLALEKDPGAHPLLREAARNAFFDYNFDLARNYISQARLAHSKSRKEEIIFADLTTQLYCRESEYSLSNGNDRTALSCMQELLDFLDDCPSYVFDRMHVEHLTQAFRVIDNLKRNPHVKSILMLEELEEKIHEIRRGFIPSKKLPINVVAQAGDSEVRARGYLKEAGRTEVFGFLKDESGFDTYIRREWVEEDLWQAMCRGDIVFYNIIRDGQKTYALNVIIA